MVITCPAITVAGASKLVEISDYLWKTSAAGQICYVLERLGWIAMGVVITILIQWLVSA
ncbi:hypothetical protein [Rubinisphaera sp.]|uniref:hypothetical protein n=1 Tax=Rubinisphaera sp. TaxID=2024857 RepID=UPI0025FA249A|nr:hypothetical protein [Rubinisphaera sp.]|tara:strand:- start:2675 stop:2851 length:177 start_codon:yes stop_codon:yes gene_type:complete